jgi:polyphosphate kinase 2 (PPK2 family)
MWVTRNGLSLTDTTAAERSKAAKVEDYSVRKKLADKTRANTHSSVPEGKAAKLKNKEFESQLGKLQAELVKVQLWVQHKGLQAPTKTTSG